MDKPYIKH